MIGGPTLKLNNGKTIPVLGLGTWKSKPDDVIQAVKDAIDIGYRHIDCAHVYENENQVGEAIRSKITEGVVSREDLFVTSKLWNTFHRPSIVEDTFQMALKDLGLEYLDLYLLHWPMGYKEGNTLYPSENGKTLFSDVDYLDTWMAMEELIDSGLVKSIGISNFNRRQVERILAEGTVKPVVNQVECHPYLSQQKLSRFLKTNDIVLTAYSPLGSPDRPRAKPGEARLMDNPKIGEIAKKYEKSPAQILVRYQVDRGHSLVPKSVTKQWIAQNYDVFDFKLATEDVQLINDLDCNGRLVPILSGLGHKYHPFQNDEY